MAHFALQCLRVALAAHNNLFRLQRVDGSASICAHRGYSANVRQLLEHLGQHSGGVMRGNTKNLGCPTRVPATRTAQRGDAAVLVIQCSTSTWEFRRAALREAGYAFCLGVAVMQPPGVGVIVEVLLQ